MQDASDAVDAYLTHSFGIGLEQVLTDATQGLVSLALADRVKATTERVAAYTHPDGGISETHQGILTVAGIRYRFRCTVFIDTGGLRYVENVAEFRPLMWQTRLPLPERGTR